METTEITKGYVRHFYADRVDVEYYDMAVPEQYEAKKALLDSVPKGYMYYPLVFVGEELKTVGSAEYYEVLYAVREVLGDE